MIYAGLDIDTGGTFRMAVDGTFSIASTACRILRAAGADKERLDGLLAAEAKMLLDQSIALIDASYQHLCLMDLDNGPDLVRESQRFLSDLRQSCFDHPKASVHVW